MSENDDTDPIVEFDAAGAVTEYRRIMAKRDAATDELGRDEYDRMAGIARARWAEWHGEDCLHEMAFAEPVE
jgi:hypothetical protein